MTSRYDNRDIRLNFDKPYREFFRKRNVRFIRQYTTPNLAYPDREQIMDITIVPHVWKLGDRFYKLSHEYYQDPSLWWIIPWFNKIPTEAQFEIGDIVDIPLPLDSILEILEM